MKDYYKILGISRDASTEDIKRAFHKLAHKHHPHKGGDEKKFKEINEAYQVLSDTEKRTQYDTFGSSEDVNWNWGNSPSGPNVDFDLGDLSEMFGDMFGFGRKTRKRNIKKGRDIRVDVEVSLEETLKSITKEINLYKQVVCSRCQGTGAEQGTSLNKCFSCGGTGQVQQIKRTFLGSITHWTVCPECNGEGQKPEKPCNVCKGEGRVKGNEDIKIFIPAGIDSNQAIKVVGKGEAGKRGGESGDLYVRIFVKKHPVFHRQGDDLLISQPISFSRAVLGDKIDIPTLEGKILLKVPSGSESGKVLRISNKGIPRFSGFGRGNLYVELIVKIPKYLTKEQKMLLKELKKEGL